MDRLDAPHALTFADRISSLCVDGPTVVLCFNTSHIATIDTSTRVVAMLDLETIDRPYESARTVQRAKEGWKINYLSGSCAWVDATMTTLLRRTAPAIRVTADPDELMEAVWNRNTQLANAVRSGNRAKELLAEALRAAFYAGEINMLRLLVAFGAPLADSLRPMLLGAFSGTAPSMLRVMLEGVAGQLGGRQRACHPCAGGRGLRGRSLRDGKAAAAVQLLGAPSWQTCSTT